jgi:hypothetical protein
MPFSLLHTKIGLGNLIRVLGFPGETLKIAMAFPGF